MYVLISFATDSMLPEDLNLQLESYTRISIYDIDKTDK